MVQQLTVGVTALTEDPGLISQTRLTVHNYLKLQRTNTLFWPLWAVAHMWYIHSSTHIPMKTKQNRQTKTQNKTKIKNELIFL